MIWFQALYNTYDDEYKGIAGEPEIAIDVFVERNDGSGCYVYGGIHIGGDIIIDKTRDGVYDVLTAFAEVYPDEKNPTA